MYSHTLPAVFPGAHVRFRVGHQRLVVAHVVEGVKLVLRRRRRRVRTHPFKTIVRRWREARGLTVIWLRPASLMVSVGDMKYLKARSRLSLSKHSELSRGSFTVLHIRSAMLRAALCRSSWSDSLHRYLHTGGLC